MIKYFKKIAAVIALSSISSMTFAQSNCSSILLTYSLGPPSCDATCQANLQAEYPECFPSGSTTSTTEIYTTSFAQVSAISRSIASRLLPLSGGPIASASSTGLSAGGISNKLNAWGNIDQNNTDFSYRSTVAGSTKGGNDVTTTVIGFDYAMSPQMVVGLSAAFDRANGYGISPANAKTSTSTDGYQFAPYIGYQLSKDLALDASMGLGKGDFSNSGGVTASADRWFAAANLNYSRWMGNMQYTGKASYLHGEEEYGNSKVAGVTQARTGSTNKVDQVRLGAQAGYWMNGFMPFAGLTYTADVSRSNTAPGTNKLGRDAWVWSLGLNFFSLSSKVTGGLMYQVESSRTNSDNDVLTANINFRF